MSDIHPQAGQAFQEGLESILRQWTALELAVLNQWGGQSSGDKANQLYEELLDKFISKSTQLYTDELVDYLDSYMETNFCTICEDDSTTELAELLLSMWEDACRGDFTLITNALAREYMHSEVAAQCQGVDQSGDMIDDEEDGDMDEEDDQLADQNEMAGSSIASSSFGVPTTGSSSTIVNTATLPTISETGESNEMMTTEDGVEAWEEVGKKKGVSRNKGRK